MRWRAVSYSHIFAGGLSRLLMTDGMKPSYDTPKTLNVLSDPATIGHDHTVSVTALPRPPLGGLRSPSAMADETSGQGTPTWPYGRRFRGSWGHEPVKDCPFRTANASPSHTLIHESLPAELIIPQFSRF